MCRKNLNYLTSPKPCWSTNQIPLPGKTFWRNEEHYLDNFSHSGPAKVRETSWRISPLKVFGLWSTAKTAQKLPCEDQVEDDPRKVQQVPEGREEPGQDAAGQLSLWHLGPLRICRSLSLRRARFCSGHLDRAGKAFAWSAAHSKNN